MRNGLALALVCLLAPTAGAQLALVEPTLTVFASDPGKAFLPGAIEEVDVVATYQPGTGGRPAPAPTPDRPEDTEPTRISFEVKQMPSWVTDVTFDPPEVFVFMGVQNGTTASFSRTVKAKLNVSPDAPALEREDLVVVATADPNGNIRGTTAESSPLKLRATTVGILNVSAEGERVIPGGRWSTIDFAVRNDGNARLLAKVNVTLRPENSQVEFLDTVEIDRGATAIVPVRLRTPWTNAEFGALELEATPIVEGEPGTPARASVDIRGESAVPGASALLAIVALLVVARRR